MPFIKGDYHIKRKLNLDTFYGSKQALRFDKLLNERNFSEYILKRSSSYCCDWISMHTAPKGITFLPPLIAFGFWKKRGNIDHFQSKPEVFNLISIQFKYDGSFFPRQAFFCQITTFLYPKNSIWRKFFFWIHTIHVEGSFLRLCSLRELKRNFRQSWKYSNLYVWRCIKSFLSNRSPFFFILMSRSWGKYSGQSSILFTTTSTYCQEFGLKIRGFDSTVGCRLCVVRVTTPNFKAMSRTVAFWRKNSKV